jgi:GMP reductase
MFVEVFLMAQILKSKSIYYNDVNLVAQPCKVKSRKDIPLELNRIIVSPMEAIIGETFALEANNLGLSLCLHRFCSIEAQVELFNKLPNKDNVFVSIGLNDWDRVERLAEAGATSWLIDMANGYMTIEINNCVQRLTDMAHVDQLMMGNVHTERGFQLLANIASDKTFSKYVRVGIAGGSPCATNDSTGYNRGPITEIMEIEASNPWDPTSDQIFLNRKPFIIADGGIKNSGYAAKAFGAGADYVMMGGYFSKAFEAETHVRGDGYYWGGASHKQQILQTGKAHRHSEGKEIPILDQLSPLKTLVDELWGGISSAVSYGGYDTLTNFIGNGVFEIKQNSLPPRRK